MPTESTERRITTSLSALTTPSPTCPDQDPRDSQQSEEREEYLIPIDHLIRGKMNPAEELVWQLNHDRGEGLAPDGGGGSKDDSVSRIKVRTSTVADPGPPPPSPQLPHHESQTTGQRPTTKLYPRTPVPTTVPPPRSVIDPSIPGTRAERINTTTSIRMSKSKSISASSTVQPRDRHSPATNNGIGVGVVGVGYSTLRAGRATAGMPAAAEAEAAEGGPRGVNGRLIAQPPAARRATKTYEFGSSQVTKQPLSPSNKPHRGGWSTIWAILRCAGSGRADELEHC